jgi:transposase
MDESTRNEIIRMFYSRASHRRIAKTLGIDRKTVAKIIAEHDKDRTGVPPQKRKPRKSLLDPFQDNVVQLLERYPEITAVRMAEELRGLGFKGAYSIVRDHLRKLRRHPRQLVRRFETGPGVQSQMDYSPYDIDFTAEGKRRVHAFSYHADSPIMPTLPRSLLPHRRLAQNSTLYALTEFGIIPLSSLN